MASAAEEPTPGRAGAERPTAPDGSGEGAATLVLRRGPRVVPLGPVGRAERCGLGFVDDLLRLQLALRRVGWELEVVAVPAEVAELFELVGLTPPHLRP